VKFKADENLPVEVAEMLRNLGHDALSVADQQMSGCTDVKLAAVCQAKQRAIITLDLDFSDIRTYSAAGLFRDRDFEAVPSDSFSHHQLDGAIAGLVGYRTTHGTPVDR